MLLFLLCICIAGEIPCENSLLRQVSSLLRRLPAIESGKFLDDFLMVSLAYFLEIGKANDSVVFLFVLFGGSYICIIWWFLYVYSVQ